MFHLSLLSTLKKAFRFTSWWKHACIHFKAHNYNWTTHTRNPEMFMEKKHLLRSCMTFKEMRILRVILHLCGQKPTLDIKKIFRMNWTWLLMTTLLPSWTEGGINGPTGRSRSRSSEIPPPSPLTCQVTRAGPVLCSYQPLPFKRMAMPTSGLLMP